MTVKMRWHDSPHSLYHVMEHEMSIYIYIYMSGEGRAIFFFFFLMAIILLLWVAKKRLFESWTWSPDCFFWSDI